MAELAELKSDCSELKELLQIAKRPRVKDVLQNELTSVDAQIGEIERKKAKEEAKTMATDANDGPVVAEDPETKPKATAKPTNAKVRRSNITLYGFDQKPKTFTIYIELKGVGSLANTDQIQVDFGKRALNLVVSNLNGKTYELNIPNLAGEIDPENCKFKVKADKITVTLKKLQEGDWAALTKNEAKGKKQKEQEASRAPEIDTEKDPSTSLMDMMKKMYVEGDDELQRTINKAWTESRVKQAAGPL